MAKHECKLTGSFSQWLQRIESGVMNASATASLEDKSDFALGDCRCAVLVFERYSYFGGNRVSMNVTLFGKDEDIRLSAITAGGSQAMLFKVNTLGEESFLDTLMGVLGQ